MAQASLVAAMADFVTDLNWADLPEHARDSARDRVLDAISTASPRAPSRRPARRSTPRRCSVRAAARRRLIPSRERATIDGAAFVNGVAIHAILFEDINLSSSDHPGAVIVAAALAAAEGAEAITGRAATVEDLLLAVLAGYEVHLWLGTIAAGGVSARGLRTTSMFGTVGAAAAAATALRLPRDQLRLAISLGANMACGFLEGFRHGTQEPYLQAGIAAHNAVLAATLARAGAQSTEHALDGTSGFRAPSPMSPRSSRPTSSIRVG